MNIAFFLVPKLRTVWLSAGASVREALRLMRRTGRSIVPVVDADSGFMGTVSVRALLRFLRGRERDPRVAAVAVGETPCVKPGEPVGIDTEVESLFARAVDQSFVPVVDDRRVFIGIVPRRAILRHVLRGA